MKFPVNPGPGPDGVSSVLLKLRIASLERPLTWQWSALVTANYVTLRYREQLRQYSNVKIDAYVKL